MTQEEKQIDMGENLKQLLLKDLCARLPYKVLCKLKNEILPLKDVFIDGVVGNKGQLGFGINKYGRVFQEIDEIKPYLRPMPSMTEEEFNEYRSYCRYHNIKGTVVYEDTYKSFDWLNKKMFDYRGLISMGLALEASEGMYKIK